MGGWNLNSIADYMTKKVKRRHERIACSKSEKALDTTRWLFDVEAN